MNHIEVALAHIKESNLVYTIGYDDVVDEYQAIQRAKKYVSENGFFFGESSDSVYRNLRVVSINGDPLWTLNDFEKQQLNSVLEGKSLEDFRFFGEAFVSGSGGSFELTECQLQNAEYGMIEVVPVDYPKHDKRSVFIIDLPRLFKDTGSCEPQFVKKTFSDQKVVDFESVEYITPRVYLVHRGKTISK